ncbi:MAG TPA: hypothetical protein VNM37_05635, partial [Candidatus Dormibacteraeota bacterium]|nr:hypothetical protein [Candidatus Dormibacteraeota bacterium]
TTGAAPGNSLTIITGASSLSGAFHNAANPKGTADIGGTTWIDVYDSPAGTLVLNSLITAVSPSSGALIPGTSQIISWTNPAGFSGNVDLALSTDGGATFTTTIASQQPNNGSFNWTVPNILTAQGRIRVQSSSGGTPAGTSSGDFAINGTIIEVSPNNGTLIAGTSRLISWANPTGFNGNVDLALSTDGGATFGTNIALNQPNRGNFSWTVPAISTAQGRIRVRSSSGDIPSGISSDNFAITLTSAITNVSPTGGILGPGAGTTITWTNPAGFSGNVDIALSTDGGATFATIVAINQPNTGSFNWTVPNVFTTQGRIRVQATSGGTPGGISANNFGIAEETFVVNTLADSTTSDDFLSLREAILLATHGGDTSAALGRNLTIAEAGQVSSNATSSNFIQFVSGIDGGTITLTSFLNDDSVFGPSAFWIGNNTSLTIDGQTGLVQGITIARATGTFGSFPLFRLFDVAAGSSLTLDGLTLSNGNARGGNGGLAGGGGAAGMGGAIFNRGTLTIQTSTLTGHTARGGNAIGGQQSGGGGGVGSPGESLSALSAPVGASGGGPNGGQGGFSDYEIVEP